MEKFILLGVGVWISFVLMYGFQPPRPVKNPGKQKTEISKQAPCPPDELKYRWIKTHCE